MSLFCVSLVFNLSGKRCFRCVWVPFELLPACVCVVAGCCVVFAQCLGSLGGKVPDPYEPLLRGGLMLEGLRGRACCRTVLSLSFPLRVCRATVEGHETLYFAFFARVQKTTHGAKTLCEHVGQTAWQNALEILANHLCRPCWPLPLPGGFVTCCLEC